MHQDQFVGNESAVLLVHLLRDGVALNDRDELIALALSAGARVVEVIDANVRRPDPRLFIGSGKVEEIRQQIVVKQPDLVIFNMELTPSQERNLETYCQCRVIDRTRLILDIFALRASSHEGKLQVELAQLNYLSTRLVRGWTHLERQRGGIGLRGPGETQLESDRRMLRGRVARLKKQLKTVNKRRELGRNSRNTIVIALAGYTNVGKTSLFNLLCDDNQYVADQVFASLDTKLRRLSLPGMRQAVLIDTVGFVENLPHQLIEAFASTLEEVVHANLILHLCDASDDKRNDKIKAVQEVLKEIGASDIPQLMVWNKYDLLDDQQKNLLPMQMAHDLPNGKYDDGLDGESDLAGEVGLSVSPQVGVNQSTAQLVDAVAISVQTSYGITALREAIVTKLAPKRMVGWYAINDQFVSQNRAWLHKHHAIKQEIYTNEGKLCLFIEADAAIVQSLKGVEKIEIQSLG